MTRSRAKLSYETRALLYFDLLGWKELIGQSEDQPDLIQGLVHALDAPSFIRKLGPGLQISQFSDHVCISAKGTTNGFGIVCIFGKVVLRRLLEEGFCARGAGRDGPPRSPAQQDLRSGTERGTRIGVEGGLLSANRSGKQRCRRGSIRRGKPRAWCKTHSRRSGWPVLSGYSHPIESTGNVGDLQNRQDSASRPSSAQAHTSNRSETRVALRSTR